MSSSRFSSLKRHCCFTTVQLAAKHLRRAQELISTGKHEDVAAAIDLLGIALELYPGWEKALELKARALLYLKRFTDVVELLHEFLPGENRPSEQCADLPSSSLLAEDKAISSPQKAIGRIMSARFLLSPMASSKTAQASISSPNSLRRKLFNPGLCKGDPPERLQWRYLILGQACCHLGMMEEALVLLQNGKKTASAASRCYSNGMRDDNFCSESSVYTAHAAEFDLVNQMLANIKLLLRRRAAAEAALEAGLYAESVRHFTKIIENQKNTPQGFIADCFLHRAIAYQATGRVVDAIADCNWNLALNPRCTKALSLRASLHEMVKSFSECLLDFQQLKMIYEASLRQQAQTNWAVSDWRLERRSSLDTNIADGLDYINSKIAATRRRLCGGTCPLAARTILDLPQQCSMEDVEKAYLLLSLKHSPDKAVISVRNCGWQGGRRDIEMVEEEARASAKRLSSLIHKAYTKLLSVISEEEAEEQHEHNVREFASKRRCARRELLLQSCMGADRMEEKSRRCVESSDEYSSIADDGVTEFEVSDEEGHDKSILDSNCSSNDGANNENLAKPDACVEEGQIAEDLYRESLRNRGLERVATPEKQCAKAPRNAHHIEQEEVVSMRESIEAEIHKDDGDSNMVMMVVMEALTSFKQSGATDVDMESRAEKMIRAALCAEPANKPRTHDELCQVMMNNQQLLARAISQALSMDSPNLLAHQHWLDNIQDSLFWALPISQPLSVT